MSDLLFEIGTEEIPAGYLAPAIDQLVVAVRKLLEERRLPAERVWGAGTPRHLTVAASGIPGQQPAVREEIIGPPAKVAFNQDGSPGKAAVGFARAQGVPVEGLIVKQTAKGPYVAAAIERGGASATQVLPDVLREAALSVSFPKSMRWPVPSSGPAIRFARPIRWLVALLDAELLRLDVAGVEAGRATYGHPFLAPGPLELDGADYDAYRNALRERFVVVDMDERKDLVRRQVEHMLGADGEHTEWVDPLWEVVNLVEWPHAVEGTFDEKFLQVPDAIVCAAMIEHQRYFPVWDKAGKLLNRFVVVSNRGPEQEETVREGNERVLRARLEDARFFWEEDRATPLDERVPRLAGVVYLGGLGNNLQRTERLEELSARVARMMKLERKQTESVRRAAHLCKADLLTGLVGEFPGLQGMVGRELLFSMADADWSSDDVYRVAIAKRALPSKRRRQPCS